MEQLAAAVNAGLVKVVRHQGGWAFTGATNDALVLADLERMGAVWLDDLEVWFIADLEGEQGRALERMGRKSKAVAAAVAARGIRAKRDGAREYDKRREARIRAAARGIRDVYRLALLEHEAELRKVIEAGKDPQLDPVEAIKLKHRRGELESVIDALADGLADAGKSAAALTMGMLPESRATARHLAAWQVDNIAGVHVSRLVGDGTAALATLRDYNKPKWSEAEIAEATKLRKGYDAKAWDNLADKNAAKKLLKTSIARGLLTGEHPEKIAKRIEGSFNQWERRAVVIARTETARIMSEATQEYIRDADNIGVKVKNRWDATLDGSTRESHRKCDGEVRAVGEKFSNGSKRPGDGPAGEVINCRCCLTPVLEGFAPNAPIRRDNESGATIPYMTYSQWEKWREEQAQTL